MMARIAFATIGIGNLGAALGAASYMVVAEAVELLPSLLVLAGGFGMGLSACAWEALEPVRPDRLPDEVTGYRPDGDCFPHTLFPGGHQ